MDRPDDLYLFRKDCEERWPTQWAWVLYVEAKLRRDLESMTNSYKAACAERDHAWKRIKELQDA